MTTSQIAVPCLCPPLQLISCTDVLRPVFGPFTLVSINIRIIIRTIMISEFSVNHVDVLQSVVLPTRHTTDRLDLVLVGLGWFWDPAVASEARVGVCL